MNLKTERPVPREPDTLACATCLSDIPASVAESLEGPDYVQHFCGIECMDRWRRRENRVAVDTRS